MTAYLPEQHVHDLGVSVIREQLPTRRDGLYIPRLGAIYLRPGLHPYRERCVLAHEIVHAEDGTKHAHGSREHHRMIENRCDMIAAKRLVHFDDLFAEMRRSDDPGQWAANLHVTGRIIRARLRHLRPEQATRLHQLREEWDYAA